ncbi:MAG: HlyC/CorC family transporter [Verrucomicrobia bacterium]|nr:HlyC/CorC family transporter [Verrucomicrobiota bacterium]
MFVTLIVVGVTCILLLGCWTLEATASGYWSYAHSRSRESLQELPYLSFYRSLLRPICKDKRLEGLFFSISVTKHVMRLLFVAWGTLLFVAVAFGQTSWTWIIPLLVLLASLVIGDFLPRALGTKYPKKALTLSAPFTTLFLLLCTPLIFLILLITHNRLVTIYVRTGGAPVGQMKEKIIEMIHQAEVASSLDESDKKLLEGVAGFRDRIVREVMCPRVDLVALPINVSLKEAAMTFQKEGYSRIPIYREDIDHIVGILLYKDFFAFALQHETLEGEVEPLLAKPLFVSETTRVTRLLQEFRQKQTHLAIVVDEYGGTEGIVTMEDCLEEIVGEITDETDEEAHLYAPHPEKGWLVDARMTIHEVEEEFDIKIPHEGDYNTIGGYAFHCAGEIPSPGLQIHHDQFDLEILEVTERTVEKVRLTPKH